jgi:hypothetical protein
MRHLVLQPLVGSQFDGVPRLGEDPLPQPPQVLAVVGAAARGLVELEEGRSHDRGHRIAGRRRIHRVHGELVHLIV